MVLHETMPERKKLIAKIKKMGLGLKWLVINIINFMVVNYTGTCLQKCPFE